jgi:hypothetical protein
VKRPPEERARLLRLMGIAAAGLLVIVVSGVLAVVGGVFDPSREERARDFVEREYGARLGACEEVAGDRLECGLERASPELLDRLGRPPRERVCVFVFENASVVLDGWAPCRSA